MSKKIFASLPRSRRRRAGDTIPPEAVEIVTAFEGCLQPTGNGRYRAYADCAHGWDVPTIGGHLLEGSIVKGVVECFITEILGIDVLYPSEKPIDPHADEFPENWYQEVD